MSNPSYLNFYYAYVHAGGPAGRAAAVADVLDRVFPLEPGAAQISQEVRDGGIQQEPEELKAALDSLVDALETLCGLLPTTQAQNQVAGLIPRVNAVYASLGLDLPDFEKPSADSPGPRRAQTLERALSEAIASGKLPAQVQGALLRAAAESELSLVQATSPPTPEDVRTLLLSYDADEGKEWGRQSRALWDFLDQQLHPYPGGALLVAKLRSRWER